MATQTESARGFQVSVYETDGSLVRRFKDAALEPMEMMAERLFERISGDGTGRTVRVEETRFGCIMRTVCEFES